ncbi:MAG: RDD family protein, partial [Planctomycetota bacterium]|nr:RDD family protein [Planctomycetota bacterium]
QSLLPLRTLHMLLLFVVAITVLLLVLIFKPGSQAAAPTLPATVAVLGLAPRLLALTIDLALGGVATILLLRCTPAELLRLPMWTADIADTAPSLWLIGITMMHCTLGEIVAARSVGKALLGARVVAAQGARPVLGSILVRNAFKLIVLLIPVLAVFALLNHHLQGLGDLMARTIVVHEVSPKN